MIESWKKMRKMNQKMKKVQKGIDDFLPTFSVGMIPAGNGGDNRTLWIALFAVGITGIAALYVSSRKISRLKKEQEEMLKRHKEMEKQFNEVFSRMGQNIYELGKEVVDVTGEVMQKVGEEEIGGKLKSMLSTETKILDTTSTLLEFLRIKAGKVTYQSEPFNLNRVFDEVVGNLGSRMQSSEEVELIFRIDKGFPRDVEGDFTNLADALTYLLEHALIQSSATEVTLDATAGRGIRGRHSLNFLIEYRNSPERSESVAEYFRPVYDEEEREYRRLECFIAKELAEIMEGKLDVEIWENRVRLILSIPVDLDEKERRRYRLRSLELTNKSVLVVNRNPRASEAIAGLFSYFRHHAEVMELSEYEKRRPPLVKYDILVVEEPLVDALLIEYVGKIRRHKELKIVSVRNIFAPAEAHFDEEAVDARLTKPLTLERVYQLIEELYPPADQVSERPQKREKAPKKEEEKAPEQSRTFLREIPVTPHVGLADFSQFAGSSLLIVEDNEINRRMLLKVLERSGIELATAENGQKALEAVREKSFDLVLMDINMPVMDGYTATVEIRKLPAGEQLPIIALSALNVENELDRMRESGLDGYLPKPLNIGQLYTAFERYLSRSAEKGTAKEARRIIRYPEAIEMQKALENTGGNELLLRDVLREFVELYGKSDRLFTALYERGDFDRMRAEMVDLLGLSGTIGAQDLYVALKELYKVLLWNDTQKVPERIAAYASQLKRLNDSVRDYLLSAGEEDSSES